MSTIFQEQATAPTKAGNNWRAILITPGKGSSGIYTESVLKEYGPKAFPKGTHSYVDHPNSEEEVRSPKNLMAVLSEDARYEEGVGLVAELDVMPHWKEFVEAVAPHTGLSIYAMGEGNYNDEGEVVVENLIPHTQNSVDLVSYPGRPGSKLADKLYEAARAMATAEYDKDKKKKKKLYEELPDNYRPATSEDVPEGRACGNCLFFNENNVNEDGQAFCEKWDDYVAGGNYCNAWKGKEEASAPMSGKEGTAAHTAAATQSNKEEGYSDMELKELSDQLAELPNLVAAAVAEALAPAVESEEKEEVDVAAVAEALVAADLPEISRKAVYESLRAGADLNDAVESQKAFVESVKSHFKEEAAASVKATEETVIVNTEEKAPRLSDILNVKVGA